jgi:putative PIN family toxin of toxin-antitoxin system
VKRVVIDTNVFVLSFFGGNPRRIVDLWKTGKLTLCLTRGIIDEYVEVLNRLGLEGEHELKELLGLFAQGFNCIFTAKTPKVKVVKEDPDDDKFIECAVALKAQCIISGDKALLAVKNYVGIKILNPRDFLNTYKLD